MKIRYILGIAFLLGILFSGPMLGQQWKLVAVLATDVTKHETDLVVDVLEPVQPGKMIRIETRDGRIMETYEVRHFYEDHVILMEPLKKDYIAGAKIYQ
jgi:hypothetical protein